MKKRSLLLAVVVLGATATTAVASSSTWSAILGTLGNDTINASAQTDNYFIYGLAGKDNITGSKSDNFLVGDGHCPPGEQGDNLSQTKHGNFEDVEYCDTGEVKGDGGDTLHGGGRDNTLIGGGGPNVMYGGGGHNLIYAGSDKSGTSAGTGNLIYGGQSGDVIVATQGTSTIYPGKGTNAIYTRNGNKDFVYCSGRNDYVFADQYDVVKNCAHVYVDKSSKDRAASKRAASRKAKHGTVHRKTKNSSKTAGNAR